MTPQQSAKGKKLKADFCIEVDFEKGSESPSRVFRAMTDIIETFQNIDESLIESIDASIEPIVVIEDIEAGSIKTWLAYAIRAIDDNALKDLDWKKQVGKYLVKAKYLILNFIDGKIEIKQKEEIEQLEDDLLNLAKETDVTHIPAYHPVRRQRLLPDIEQLTHALSNLSEHDRAIYITHDNQVNMNAQFTIVPERIEELLTKETITTPTEMILKVKKPDYLGESMWEFRHEAHPISAKILDKEWLDDFQNRKHDVRPGDSLRAMVKIEVRYGYDGEVVGVHHYLTKVFEIIKGFRSDQLIVKAKDLPDSQPRFGS